MHLGCGGSNKEEGIETDASHAGQSRSVLPPVKVRNMISGAFVPLLDFLPVPQIEDGFHVELERG